MKRRRATAARTREVPRELVNWGRDFTVPGERKALGARFAHRFPGMDLVADVAQAAGVEVADVVSGLPDGLAGCHHTAEEASSAELVGALPRIRQSAARRVWLDRYMPPDRHEEARTAMLMHELCFTYGRDGA